MSSVLGFVVLLLSVNRNNVIVHNLRIIFICLHTYGTIFVTKSLKLYYAQ